jgi:hypothetical protein
MKRREETHESGQGGFGIVYILSIPSCTFGGAFGVSGLVGTL